MSPLILLYASVGRPIFLSRSSYVSFDSPGTDSPFLSCVCNAFVFVRVRLFVPCGHLLGKD